MSHFEKKREQVGAIVEAFENGNPSPAWDQAWEMMTLLETALDIISQHPAAQQALEDHIRRVEETGQS